jgi:hypothetical protein
MEPVSYILQFIPREASVIRLNVPNRSPIIMKVKRHEKRLPTGRSRVKGNGRIHCNALSQNHFLILCFIKMTKESRLHCCLALCNCFSNALDLLQIAFDAAHVTL